MPFRQWAAGPGSQRSYWWACCSCGLLNQQLAPWLLDLLSAHARLVVQVFLTSDGLAQTVTTAIPLAVVGLGAAMAFRVGFWNIGLEGQLILGAIAATAVSVADLGPEPLRVPLMLLVAALAGAAWIVPPLFLRQRLGVSEIVVTLLLSNIAYLLLQHVLFGALRSPAASTSDRSIRSFRKSKRITTGVPAGSPGGTLSS